MQKVGRETSRRPNVATSSQREWKSTSDKRRDVETSRRQRDKCRKLAGTSRRRVNENGSQQAANVATSQRRDVNAIFFCLTIIKRKRGPKFEGIEESTEIKAAGIRSVEKTVGFLFSYVLKEC